MQCINNSFTFFLGWHYHKSDDEVAKYESFHDLLQVFQCLIKNMCLK